MSELQDSLVELIRRTSAEIPEDVHQAILGSLEQEKKGTIAASAMKIIDQNIALAKNKSQPICQDTGSILFYVDCPVGYDQLTFADTAREAVTLATKKGFLRQNSVDCRPGSAGVPFSSAAVAGGCRATGAQGRRVRKRWRAVLPARGEAQRQSRPRRLPEGDPGRRVAGAGQGLRTGDPGCVHRR
jgi:hypothetical protein